jgi:hypothetical protein
MDRLGHPVFYRYFDIQRNFGQTLTKRRNPDGIIGDDALALSHKLIRKIMTSLEILTCLTDVNPP